MGQKMYKQPQKRELMAGSRLEISMLEFSLKESQDKLAKTQEELQRTENLLYQTNKIADQRAEAAENYLEKIADVSKKLLTWKAIAAIEAVTFIGYILLQGVF